jgi:DNA-binding winged helix-turn-helix (wHTH) protein/TolB-like protein/Tfp pilus assembly protein PilF
MEAPRPASVTFGDALFDPMSGELSHPQGTQQLRPQAAAVLSHLLRHQGELVFREDLHRAVWGDAVVTENSLAQCLAEIRRALGPAREDWVQTRARRGYLLRADLPTPTGEAPTVLAAAAMAITVPPPGHRPAPARWLMAVAVTAVLLLAAALLAVSERGPFGPATPLRAAVSLAVMPFERVLPAGGPGWVADILAEDLVLNLSRIPGARVVSTASTQAYPSGGFVPQVVARQLGVRHLVAGTLEGQEGPLTLRLQLIDGEDGRLVWGERFELDPAHLHQVERLLSGRVAHALHVKLVDAAAQRTDAATATGAADLLALQAWSAWNRGSAADVARARELALQALAIDEHTVMAWKTMASWHLRARLNQSLPAAEAERGAEEAARRAMALDPAHPLVHTVWGASQVLLGRYAEGRAALLHEIATNPSHPVAYSYLGIAELMLGEPQRAAAAFAQAVDISPRDPRLSRFERYLALSHLHAGQLDAAVQHARAATQAPQVDRAAWPVLAAACALVKDAACLNDARAGMLRTWPAVTLALVESEWPPATPAFKRQHAAFLAGLAMALP